MRSLCSWESKIAAIVDWESKISPLDWEYIVGIVDWEYIVGIVDWGFSEDLVARARAADNDNNDPRNPVLTGP